MQYSYNTSGTCSRQILIDVEDNVIQHIKFVGGCPGNVQGVARLSENRSMDEVIALCEGIRCGAKPTSCPDQLAKALKLIKEQQAQAEA